MMVVLAMIVRDEAHCIERTLRSALPHVDAWCIADTGSTDDTAEIVKHVCADKPGKLLEYPFDDFSQARNRVLDAIEPGAIVLWLDAEDERLNASGLRSLPPGDCWSIIHLWSDGQAFMRPTIVRASSGWRFKGRVHELLTRGTEAARNVDDVVINHVLTSQGIAKSQARWVRDVEWLEQDLADDPTDERARAYLERTKRALRSANKATGIPMTSSVA